MHAKQLSYCALLFTIIATAGCQSWQGASFPLQNATRVAPPGTGTYQLPTGYYNNSTSALAPAGQMMQASNGASSTLRTASGPLPTTNMTANQSAGNFATSSANSTYPTTGLSTGSAGAAPTTGLGPQANATDAVQSVNSQAGAVVPAAFQSEASGLPLGSTTNFSDSSGTGASASLSDAPNAEVPSLQWQQFGGQ